MNPETRYRLAEAKFNERVAAFRASPDTASLADEISLARGLIESRLNEAKTPAELASASVLVRDLLGVLGSLCRAHHAREKEMSELLGRQAVEQLAKDMVHLVVEVFGKLPNAGDLIDEFAERLAATIDGAKNKKGEV